MQTVYVCGFRQMMKKSSFVMDKSKNSTDHKSEVTLTLLHTKIFTLSTAPYS